VGPSPATDSPSSPPAVPAEHVFISYASEDHVVADWLARRLAAEGYAVWYDRLKLLGGEPWPTDIDIALTQRSCRVLALLSRASLQKPRPQGERIKAQNLAIERKIPDFLIPVLIEQLDRGLVPWELSAITNLSLVPSWADGLRSILKKFESVGVPRPLADGRALAVQASGFDDFTSSTEETVFSNCFPVIGIPRSIHVHEFGITPPAGTEGDFSGWPHRLASPGVALSFQTPTAELRERYKITSSAGPAWASTDRILGIASRDLVVSLIHASIREHMLHRGLKESVEDRRRTLYFPRGLLDKDWLKFRDVDNAEHRLLACGERTHVVRGAREAYTYHLAPSLRVLRGSRDPFVLATQVRLHFLGPDGTPLSPRSRLARRKEICKSWWNDDWRRRVLAVVGFLAQGTSEIVVGRGDSAIRIAATPERATLPIGIDEKLLEKAAWDRESALVLDTPSAESSE
jgi:hypothetical protein